MGRSFAQRSHETELMDTEAVSLDDYRACLKDLATVNALTLTHGPILRWLDQTTRSLEPGERVTVLDVGYGYGDLLRRIHAWSRRRRRTVSLIGVDLNPMSEPIAREATPAGVPIEYRTGNVFDYQPEQPVDFIISSQTTHHMSDQELAAFVRWMEQVAARGWFIADLHRHAIPFHVFRVLSRAARWHRFIQHDGPVSIARSFRRQDWEQILDAAGLAPDAARIRWHVPFRLCVSRLK
ncbi:methyltransferase domain-containing protein [Microvirga arsenatis]|uniref:Methyltransferase domain-containing protein n=1 Tax=Microvirga arsenatis TaxID=2692265 RepID=A0ABW9Z0A3_9HYPH|nr:methyltransferase domain-containing protein [Microvirga arsenatis]NBJ12074.1 methyltransferase domain-containing protein [Microvirga arsenatis]NBJ25935.1 methyltransferase domain-containing protein [Microvirga arsenatis]